MNKEAPVSNRICFYQDLKRVWDIHESKVLNQGPVVDSQKPPSLTMRTTQTWRGLSSSRKQQIQTQNNCLLKKLLYINQNSRIKRKGHTKLNGLPNLAEINRTQRDQKAKRIQKQNVALVSRLNKQVKPSAYSTKTLSSMRQKTQDYINLISKYPYKNLQRNKTVLKFEMRNSPNKCLESQSPLAEERRSVPQSLHAKNKADVIASFQETKYLITGELKSSELEVTIRNTTNAGDKHTLRVDPTQASRLIKNLYGGSLKSLLQSVAFDSERNHFYIKLPPNQL